MLTARLLAAAGTVAAVVSVARPQDDGPFPLLRFASRADHVELDKTRGALDLQKPFTIEVWARWNTDILDKGMFLAGDEAWPGMSPNLPVSIPSGWVIRTTPIRDADRQAIEFNVGASVGRSHEWHTLRTAYRRIPPKEWQHIAVCRSGAELRIFWNGKLAANSSIAGLTLHSSPSNLFLGVRKDGFTDREFVGDIRAFHVFSRAGYSTSFTPPMPLKKNEKTIALLEFDAADDNHVPDVSGHGRHGLVVGAKLIHPKK